MHNVGKFTVFFEVYEKRRSSKQFVELSDDEKNPRQSLRPSSKLFVELSDDEKTQGRVTDYDKQFVELSDDEKTQGRVCDALPEQVRRGCQTLRQARPSSKLFS
ncbi:hypothetical protein AVEN_67362-1 [Araneus ventricosus]|uniref:Uncharacterized protein n=1 Tax=Araneus ventricosus TaxID=182803 RepID=A0A4Y2KJA0_ARAVE|nr:hypothetical protein AVEN_67362-1 [Araneus ventricosus]